MRWLWLLALGLFLALLVGAGALIVSRGDRTTRAAFAALAVAYLLTIVAGFASPTWARPQFLVMAIDAALCVALFAIAVRSERYWPQWAVAAQFAGTVTHLVKPFEPLVSAEMYAILQPLWGVLVLLLILYGALSPKRNSNSWSGTVDSS